MVKHSISALDMYMFMYVYMYMLLDSISLFLLDILEAIYTVG